MKIKFTLLACLLFLSSTQGSWEVFTDKATIVKAPAFPTELNGLADIGHGISKGMYTYDFEYGPLKDQLVTLNDSGTNNTKSMSTDEYWEWYSTNYTGTVVLTAFGLIYFIVFPLGSSIMLFLRNFNICGGRRFQDMPASAIKRSVYAAITFVAACFVLSGAALSISIASSLEDIPASTDTFINSLVSSTDVYLDQLVSEFKEARAQTTQFLKTDLTKLVDNIPSSLITYLNEWDIYAGFVKDVNDTIDTVYTISAPLNTEVTAIKSSLAQLETAYDESSNIIATTMTDQHSDLMTRCSAGTGNTDEFTSAECTTMVNLGVSPPLPILSIFFSTANISLITLQENIPSSDPGSTGVINQAIAVTKEALEVETIVNNNWASFKTEYDKTINDVTLTLGSHFDEIDSISTNFNLTKDVASATEFLKEDGVKDALKAVSNSLYGFFALLLVAELLAIVASVYALALFPMHNRTYPYERPMISNILGYLLLTSLVILSICSYIYTLPQMAFFFATSTLQPICDDLEDYSLFTATLDDPSVGHPFSEVFFGSETQTSLDVTYASAISDCKNGKSLSEIIDFPAHFNIKEYLDFYTLLENNLPAFKIDNIMDKLNLEKINVALEGAIDALPTAQTITDFSAMLTSNLAVLILPIDLSAVKSAFVVYKDVYVTISSRICNDAPSSTDCATITNYIATLNTMSNTNATGSLDNTVAHANDVNTKLGVISATTLPALVTGLSDSFGKLEPILSKLRDVIVESTNCTTNGSLCNYLKESIRSIYQAIGGDYAVDESCGDLANPCAIEYGGYLGELHKYLYNDANKCSILADIIDQTAAFVCDYAFSYAAAFYVAVGIIMFFSIFHMIFGFLLANYLLCMKKSLYIQDNFNVSTNSMLNNDKKSNK